MRPLPLRWWVGLSKATPFQHTVCWWVGLIDPPFSLIVGWEGLSEGPPSKLYSVLVGGSGSGSGSPVSPTAVSGFIMCFFRCCGESSHSTHTIAHSQAGHVVCMCDVSATGDYCSWANLPNLSLHICLPHTRAQRFCPKRLCGHMESGFLYNT